MLAVNNGEGPVLPSRQTVEKAHYQPLSRPLFIYVNARAAQNKPAVKEFVDFYNEKAPTLVSSVGYVPLPEEAYDLNHVHFYTGKVGTLTLCALKRRRFSKPHLEGAVKRAKPTDPLPAQTNYPSMLELQLLLFKNSAFRSVYHYASAVRSTSCLYLPSGEIVAMRFRGCWDFTVLG